MECLGQLCSIVPCLWECSNKHAAYIRRLEDNLNSLRNAMDNLNSLSQDVKNRVHDAQEQHRRLRNQVTRWLLRVEALKQRVDPLLAMGTQEVENKCVGSCCPKNCWSSYRLGKKVMVMIPEVRALIDEGRFDDVADDILVAAPVDEVPMEGPVVGFESKFEEVWQSVQDKDSSIVGLVGIGGVGKTTLLKQLNNEFLKSDHGFDLVIWVVVSKPADLGRIQNTVRTKLNIPDRLWDNRSDEDKAILIFNALKNKKFVVLLDDLWERLELSKVGFPIPQRGMNNTSRVVFTTRSEEVCVFLDAHKIIKVGCLPPHVALDLFISKVGEKVLKSHPEMKELVKDVASECGGLPLALITIGRAMRGKTDARQWKDAKKTLMTYPSIFPGVKGEIFSKLIFSYDSLPSRTVQKCFEYCSIFPEDYEIPKDELIRLWNAEGIIDEYGDIYDAHIQGRQIVETLMQSCLLEACDRRWDVKMHDVIRDMALWLAWEQGEKKNKILVADVVSGGDHGMPAMTQWKNAEKVSLWGRGITVRSLIGLSFCSNLVTLIISRTSICELPIEIFKSVTTLKILDLSSNQKLTELPAEIGSLINLEYLDVTGSCVERLPVNIQQLKKLKFLLLNDTTSILQGVISDLGSLQTFVQLSYGEGGITEKHASEVIRMRREMLGELEGLEQIMDLSLVLFESESMQILLDSPKLLRCTRVLTLNSFRYSSAAVFDFCTAGRSMVHLERLSLRKCNMSVIKLGSSFSFLGNLQQVDIFFCSKVRNVSSLVYITNLCSLTVFSCSSMEELIDENDIDMMTKKKVEEELFSSLTDLVLYNLPKLRSICPQTALPFPSLKLLEVYSCPNLKELPLDLNTEKTIPPEFKIKGEKKWWDELQWDNQETKDAFTPKFQQLKVDMMTKKKVDEELFSSLTYLFLRDLPKLRSICPQTALPFPSLKLLQVNSCPDLKKLPLDLNTAKTIPLEFKIKGERIWWDNILQWDTQETKDAFTPKFQRL